MNGFVNILKPKNISSAAAVSAVKKGLNTPCGHMGTLDPMASGVLPVGLGHASRLFDYLLDKEKIYRAKFLFGVTTDTLDTTGVTAATTAVIPTITEIRAVLDEFRGEIMQVPPNYSAKCVDGKRGYDLARRGVEFSLPPKKVTVLNITCDEQTGENEFSFTVKCKGGTYIRSLARDIAVKVNSLAVMSELERTAAGYFSIENGVSLEEFRASTDKTKYIIPPENAVSFPELHLTKAQAERILNGIFDYGTGVDGIYKVYSEREFWGIGIEKNGTLRIKSYVR